MAFIQTKYEGYDTKEIKRFYDSMYKQALSIGKTEEEAHRIADFFVDYYKHQFRKYS